MLVRIVFISDIELYSSGIKSALESEPDFIVSTVCSDRLHHIDESDIDVFLIDQNLISVSTLKVVKKIYTLHPGARIVLFYQDLSADVSLYINSGISGFIHRTTSISGLIASIYTILNNQAIIPEEYLEKLRSQPIELHGPYLDSSYTLTAKEVEILHYLASGNSNKQIAEHLFMSIRSVEYHLTKMYKKLQTSSRSEAVSKALSLGLIYLTDMKSNYQAQP